MQADVLIVTVTKVESQAVLEVFKKATGHDAKRVSLENKIYRDLGTINGVCVSMVRSEMGAGGLGAALLTVQKGITALSPAAVIMVGIAFGVDHKKQTIGDILVSERLRLYDLQRVGTDKRGKSRIILRGDRPHASSGLLDRFRSADEGWSDQKGKVRFGPILSGEKLVDNIDFRQQIHEFEPEAIGGEMEGAGLYTACQEGKADWILVKAICDWADGHKDKKKTEYQQLAAQNAASFVLHALQHAPFKSQIEPADEPLSLVQPPSSMNVISPGRTSRSTLPQQPYFFGREKELTTIADALSPESRSWGALIDGPGGIGKTALAIRAGYGAPNEHFSDKIFLSAKKRELTPSGEQPLEDFAFPNYIDLLSELARELGEEDIARTPPNKRANEVRRALADKKALIIIDNVETFDEREHIRLYQFLSRLPTGCKAIVTSRRRSDIDARVIRLDRLLFNESLELMDELAKTNRHLTGANEKERRNLYEITQGNPLLIKWTVGQLNRIGSKCGTVTEACEFLKSAPPENDPLEYIFGDLLDTFSESEAAVLAALVHFTQPAEVGWIADLTGLPRQSTQTALEDLADRALVVSDPQFQTFLLPMLAATFLRRKRPEAVAGTGDRLADRVYALAMQHGFQNHDQFPILEAQWPTIAAALPILMQGDNARLQKACNALNNFLNFSGRWDEWLLLSQQAEERALAASDFLNAGWRAFSVGAMYSSRQQPEETLACADRCEAHWQKIDGGAREKATAVRLRGHGHRIKKDYPAAIAAYQKALELNRALAPENADVALALTWLGNAEVESGDHISAEADYREALRIARNVNYQQGIATCTGNLAQLALRRERWPEAEALAREALTLAETVQRIELIGSNCYRIAMALVQQDRRDEALPYAHRTVDIYTKLRLPSGLEQAQAILKGCQEDSLV
jgi:nucleoside phosphorylase/tetratricopeptide (TPR) repeat protein/AAA+ ATPase superfamily predicted ATPase